MPLRHARGRLGPSGRHRQELLRPAPRPIRPSRARGARSRPSQAGVTVQRGRWDKWRYGRSCIRASMIARPRVWRPGTGRRCRAIRSGAGAGPPDPVELLEEQNAAREPDLVPVRTAGWRCRRSPSTGARPRSWRRTCRGPRRRGWTPTVRRRAPVELRPFGSPERRLVFDLNDFDETLPGPFEYDVKRMAASF